MTRHLSITLSAILVLASIATAAPQNQKWPADAPDVRSRFVDALQRIKGEYTQAPSTMAEVREILGAPDDVVNEEDGPLLPGHVLWSYGASGHLSIPTLGAVMFDGTGNARWLFGVSPVAPAEELPPEPQLRELLRLIDRVRVDFLAPATYNPRDMVAVVNTLSKLEKREVLAVIREYVRIQSGSGFLEGGKSAIVLMRFLFTVPEDEVHRTTYLGFEEYKSAELPSIPAIVIEGTPLYLYPAGCITLSGTLPNVEEYLQFYAACGTLIAEPLRPADDPKNIWEAWGAGLRKTIEETVSAQRAEILDNLIVVQLLRMIDTVHPRQFDEDELFWWTDMSQSWKQATNKLEASSCRWDERNSRYVCANDGSFIESTPEDQFARVIWDLQLEDRCSRLILHRVTDDTVYATIQQFVGDVPAIANMTVRVFAIGDDVREVSSLSVDGRFSSGSQTSGDRIQLEKGVKLRAVLMQDGKVILESGVLDVDREVVRAD